MKTCSLLELIDILERRLNKKIKISYHAWRVGDQKDYISDITRACKDLNWEPRVNTSEGVEELVDWVCDNKITIKKVLI